MESAGDGIIKTRDLPSDIDALKKMVMELQGALVAVKAEVDTLTVENSQLKRAQGPPTVIPSWDGYGYTREDSSLWEEEEEVVEGEEVSSLMLVNNSGEADSSLFLFMSCSTKYNGALFEVKFKLGGEGEGEEGKGEEGEGVIHKPPILPYVYKFFDACFNVPQKSYLQAARISSTTDHKLYLFSAGHNPFDIEACHLQSRGFSLGMNNGSLQLDQISAPKEPKPLGALFSAYGNLYFLANPYCYKADIVEPSFEKYCPATNLWEPMPSFPFYSSKMRYMDLVGYAVYRGVILVSMCSMLSSNKESQVFAFHESISQWSKVKVDTDGGVPFIGRAVVVGKTLYALSKFKKEEVLAFAFNMHVDPHGKFRYSITQLFALRGLKIAPTPVPLTTELASITEGLVHVGNLDFFHVKSALPHPDSDVEGRQYLCITKFRIVQQGGSHMIKTLHSTVFAVDVNFSDLLYFGFGFIRECEDFEPEEVTAMLEQAKRRKSQ